MRPSLATAPPPDAAGDAPRSARLWLGILSAGAALAAAGLLLGGAVPAHAAALAAAPPIPAPYLLQCEDGTDNDGDGRVDYPADPGCDYAEDPDERDPPGPPPPPPPPPPPTASAQCSDGSDNDGDGLVDMDDATGCTSPQDNNEGDDVYDLGTGGYSFMRMDDPAGGMLYSTTGGCSWLGAERNRHGIAGKLWSFKTIAHFCWNGRVVTRIDNVQKWLDTLGFPFNLIYPVSWHSESEGIGLANVALTSVFEQAEVRSCVSKTHVCLTEHPWIRFVMAANGAATCSTDLGPVSGRDCRG